MTERGRAATPGKGIGQISVGRSLIMMTRWMLLAVMAFGGTVAVALAGDDEKVTIDQVPAAVKATILKEANGATVTEIEKETKDGKTVYEAEWTEGGKEVEITVAEDGTLIEKEVEEADDDD